MSTGTTELLGHEEDATQETGLVGGQQVTARSPLQLFWRRFRKDKVAMVAAGFVVLACLVAILAPLIVKVTGAPDPNVQNPNLLDDFETDAGDIDEVPWMRRSPEATQQVVADGLAARRRVVER